MRRASLENASAGYARARGVKTARGGEWTAVQVIDILRVVVGIGALAASYFVVVHFLSKKGQYELAERCGKTAADIMKREYEGFTKYGRTHMYNHRNHYSPRLNKRFLLLVHVNYPEKDPRDEDFIRELRLIDLHENNEYGSYLGIKNRKPIECEVRERPCNSETEWYRLVSPYMDGDYVLA
jgi:hypothetical protein